MVRGADDKESTDRGRFLDLQSARFGLKYEVVDDISLTLELDVAGRPEVKDAYVQAKSKHFRGRAGHFKMPISSITLASPWRLPVVDRGVIQDILTDRMQIIGRRAGASASVRSKGPLDPELTLAAFQGSQLSEDGDVEPLAPETNQPYDSLSLYARATITPAGNEIGLVGGRITQRGASFTDFRHFWIGGVDATIDVPFERHGLRAWVEVITGSTWYPHSNPDVKEHPGARYWSARGIVAWRWGGTTLGDHYIEPFAQYGRLDPTDDANVGGTVSELSFGIAIGYWRRARLTLAYEATMADGAMPSGLFWGNSVPTDRQAIFLQAGAAF